MHDLRRAARAATEKPYSNDDIVQELEREIQMRYRVYGRKVDQGEMRIETAATRIATLKAAAGRIAASEDPTTLF